jgi:plasmid stabilization system protein ParE
MSYPYHLNQEAHDEYIEAYERYELKQKGLGNRFMNNVEKKLLQISEHPQYYGKRQNLRFREAKVDNFPYMIVYEFLPRKELIHIAAIYHGKRNSKGKFRRMK